MIEKLLAFHTAFAFIMFIALIVTALITGIYFEILDAVDMPINFENGEDLPLKGNPDEYVDKYDNQVVIS